MEIVAGNFAFMLIRVGIAVALFAVVAVIAVVLERRRRTNPPLQGQPVVPAQLDRADFPRPDAPWLVVLFTSANCESCEGLYAKVAPLESSDVAVVEAQYPGAKGIHQRYAINAAPLTVVADAQGVVCASVLGAFNASDVWSAVAQLRS
jgi:hypothetical protein